MTTSLHQRSGEQALREPTFEATTSAIDDPHPELGSEHCDFCHAPIEPGAVFHRVTIGMNAERTVAAEASTVEEVSELVVCAACQPAIERVVDGFLEQLWRHRKTPPWQTLRTDVDDEIPPTLPAPGVLSTPFGYVTPEAISIGEELLAVARRGHPQSPEGFAFGVVVGRMLHDGLTVADLHELVETFVEKTNAVVGVPS